MFSGLNPLCCTQHSSLSLDDLFSEFAVSSFAEWNALILEQLKGETIEKRLVFPSLEGINIRPLFDATNDSNGRARDTVGGVISTRMGSTGKNNIANSWEVLQGLSTMGALKSADQGVTAFLWEVDNLTAQLQDPDVSISPQNNSKGLSLCCGEDVSAVISAWDLDRLSIYLPSSSNSYFLSAFLTVALRRAGKSLDSLRGSFSWDPLCVLVTTGSISENWGTTCDRMAELAHWAQRHAPNVSLISIDCRPYHEAGAHAVQELAFSLATAVQYLRALTERGIAPETILSRTVLTFSIGSFFFMEAAKMRATRILWSHLLRAFGLSEVDSLRLKLMACTSRRHQTLYAPHHNLLRGTLQSMSGLLGGVDVLMVEEVTTDADLSGEMFSRLARNTQHILREECHIGEAFDPLAGSEYVESLTDSLAEKAWRLFQEIEGSGGMLSALQAGIPQKMIGVTAFERFGSLAVGKDTIVGVSQYPNPEEVHLFSSACASTGEVLQNRRDWVLSYRQSRNHEKCRRSIEKLGNCADSESWDAVLRAVEEGVTIGELASAMKNPNTVHSPIEPLIPIRLAQPFEKLRMAVDAYSHSLGFRPRVKVACFGELSEYKIRSEFCANYFSMVGFLVETCSYGDDALHVAESQEQSRELFVWILCSSDAFYRQWAKPFARKWKQAERRIPLFLVGLPSEEDGEGYRQAGVDDFVRADSDSVSFLSLWLSRLGICQ